MQIIRGQTWPMAFQRCSTGATLTAAVVLRRVSAAVTTLPYNETPTHLKHSIVANVSDRNSVLPHFQNARDCDVDESWQTMMMPYCIVPVYILYLCKHHNTFKHTFIIQHRDVMGKGDNEVPSIGSHTAGAAGGAAAADDAADAHLILLTHFARTLR